MRLQFCCKNKRFHKDSIIHHWADVTNHTDKAVQIYGLVILKQVACNL